MRSRKSRRSRGNRPKRDRVSYGKLFYHENYGSDAVLLRAAVYEIADHLGHSWENPISLKLLCLQMMMPYETCMAIYMDVLRLIERDDTPKLENLGQIEEIMARHFPDTDQIAGLGIRAFVKALAKCLLPELRPYLDVLLEDNHTFKGDKNMSLNQFSRTELIFAKEGMEELYKAKVAVFGIGGVGGYAVEAFARSGIGTIALFDDDKICVTNLNRQLHATRKTVGMYKVDAAKDRILEINPDCEVETYKMFYLPENADDIDLSKYDYIIDAIDTVSGKIELICRANRDNVPVISSMGAGNKVDADALEVADIYATSVCPLAKVMRSELRKRGVDKLKVVYSREEIKAPKYDMLSSCKSNCVCPPGVTRNCSKRRQIPGSTAFVPSAAGLIIAGEVIKDLAGF